jgi:hypothetical protein
LRLNSDSLEIDAAAATTRNFLQDDQGTDARSTSGRGGTMATAGENRLARVPASVLFQEKRSPRERASFGFDN